MYQGVKYFKGEVQLIYLCFDKVKILLSEFTAIALIKS